MSIVTSLLMLLFFLWPGEGDEAEKYDLSFMPMNGETWTIEFKDDSKWNYPGEDMRGEIHTELVLQWRFERQAENGDRCTGKAEFRRVVYRGKGRKKGRDFDYDVEWTWDKGYLKGKDSEADSRWIAQELKNGVILKLDRRGACEPGTC